MCQVPLLLQDTAPKIIGFMIQNKIGTFHQKKKSTHNRVLGCLRREQVIVLRNVQGFTGKHHLSWIPSDCDRGKVGVEPWQVEGKARAMKTPGNSRAECVMRGLFWDN